MADIETKNILVTPHFEKTYVRIARNKVFEKLTPNASIVLSKNIPDIAEFLCQVQLMHDEQK